MWPGVGEMALLQLMLVCSMIAPNSILEGVLFCSMCQFTVASTGRKVEVGQADLERARQWLTTGSALDNRAVELPTGVVWPVVQLVSQGRLLFAAYALRWLALGHCLAAGHPRARACDALRAAAAAGHPPISGGSG